MPQLPENYFYVPAQGNSPVGKLYELGERSAYCKNSVVLLPYSNPQKKKPEAQFYLVKKISELDEREFSPASPAAVKLKAGISKEKYIQKVLGLRQHIQQGNIYEINYCVEFFADNVGIDPVAIFLKLKKLTKAPYSALLKIGHEYIICGSPELFLKKEGDQLYSKPIKGTIRRGKTPEEDAELKDLLSNSLKERTENVMAVDVARNDLSRVATKGSVTVNKLYNIETFETVHQMVSTVSCTVKEKISFEQIMDATFPMASMTGAPKIRAMQLIDEFESFERKSYSGAMGIIDEAGDFSLSVIIRSIFFNEHSKRLSIAVGGAITYLCEPEKEYEECLLKANAMLKALDATLV